MATEAPEKPKTEQAKIEGEGFEIQRIEEIEKAAELYVEARDERMELTKIERTRKADLMKAMLDHGQKEYHFEDTEGTRRVVEIVSKEETVKVKVDRDADADPDEDEE